MHVVCVCFLSLLMEEGACIQSAPRPTGFLERKCAQASVEEELAETVHFTDEGLRVLVLRDFS